VRGAADHALARQKTMSRSFYPPSYVVHSPSIRKRRFGNDFNKGKPVPVGLPELGFGQGELVRKQRDIQGMLPSSVAENNLLILESIVKLNFVECGSSQQ